MRENFKAALAATLQWEGGYVNHPADPGGATNKGITLNTYRRYKKHATVSDLKKIPQSVVEKIYRDGYWAKAGCDKLAAGVDLATFDYAVNSGPSAARKSLMKSIGKQSDYVTVQKLCRRRLSIYRTFKHWGTFGKGWTRRINAIEAKGVMLAKDGGRKVVANEATKADKLATKQGSGGAAGGLTGGVAAADQLSGLPLMLVILAIVAGVGYAIYRAKQNKNRAKAYRDEIEGTGEKAIGTKPKRRSMPKAMKS